MIRKCILFVVIAIMLIGCGNSIVKDIAAEGSEASISSDSYNKEAGVHQVSEKKQTAGEVEIGGLENEDSEEQVWDKERFLGGTLQYISDELRQLIVYLPPLEEHQKSEVDQITETLGLLSGNLYFMIIDPETNQYLTDQEIETMESIISQLEELGGMNQHFLNDSGDDSLPVVEEVIEETLGVIDSMGDEGLN